ncbi:dihydrofolate reductase family protein [Amycolatopsis sp.]|uniref:dihydrofolate reductase family protein n=1 Tax=Amycolatopsis sp. TaxID=37632 RepID=UPI002DFD44F8|nr:dihydrofolate reductase family protein [Amycolatopsis sp.]
MRKLIYFVASTLDGFIAAPDGQDPTGIGFFVDEGDHQTEVLTEFPDIIPAHARAHLGLTDVENKHFDTVIMGRVTYEPGLKLGVTSPYAHLRQYVVSRSITESPDPAVEIISEDPLAKVRELKAEDGKDIWLCGGGKLAGVLRPEIDELILKLNPVIAGDGVPLFAGGFESQHFTLSDTKIFTSGVMHLTYVRKSA